MSLATQVAKAQFFSSLRLGIFPFFHREVAPFPPHHTNSAQSPSVSSRLLLPPSHSLLLCPVEGAWPLFFPSSFFQLRHGPWSIAVRVSVSRFLLHSMRVKRDARIAWERLFPDGMPSFRAVIALDFVLGFPFWFLFLIFFWWVVLLFSFRVLCFICCGC